MGDLNPIRTLRDYSKPSHEGYRNTIELPVGKNMVPLRSDTIKLVQNGCSFHGLRSEDPNQHIKDFQKLMDSLDLNGENKERTRLGEAKAESSMEACKAEFINHEMSEGTKEVKSEEEVEEETKDEAEEKEKERNLKHFDTFPTMNELKYHGMFFVLENPRAFIGKAMIRTGNVI
ncbi:hypothetical protein Tco_1405724 [Tanacetum coccineum]